MQYKIIFFLALSSYTISLITVQKKIFNLCEKKDVSSYNISDLLKCSITHPTNIKLVCSNKYAHSRVWIPPNLYGKDSTHIHCDSEKPMKINTTFQGGGLTAANYCNLDPNRCLNKIYVTTTVRNPSGVGESFHKYYVKTWASNIQFTFQHINTDENLENAVLVLMTFVFQDNYFTPDKAKDVMRPINQSINNIVSFNVECISDLPIKLVGTLKTNQVENIKWLQKFYGFNQVHKYKNETVQILSNCTKPYVQRRNQRHNCTFPRTLQTFDLLTLDCVSELSSSTILYSFKITVHDLTPTTATSLNFYQNYMNEFECSSEDYDDVNLVSLRCSNKFQCANRVNCLTKRPNKRNECTNFEVMAGNNCMQTFPHASCQTVKILSSPGGISHCSSNKSHLSLNYVHIVGFDGKIYDFNKLNFPKSAVLLITVKDNLGAFYTYQNVTFTCTAHEFVHTTKLIIWELDTNSSTTSAEDLIHLITEHEFNIEKPHSSTVSIMLNSTGITQIICSVPYPEKWIDTAKIIHVQNSVKPTILQREKYKYFEDGMSGSLECEASGIPTPTIEWIKLEGENLEYPLDLINDTLGRSILRFSKFNKSNQGTYKCIASNHLDPPDVLIVEVFVKHDIVPLTYVLAFLLSLTLTMLLCVVFYKKCKRTKHILEFLDTLESIDYETSYEDDIDYKTDHLISKDGRSSLVYKGTCKGICVAVKVSKMDAEDTCLASFFAEILCMIHLQPNGTGHLNIVRLIGVCTKDLLWQGKIKIATELCEQGSIESILKEYRKAALEGNESSLPVEELPSILLRWAQGVAFGLYYLQRHNIVHGDLAARNVVIASDGTPKITDFGLSALLFDKPTYQTTFDTRKRHNCPIRWTAPEALNGCYSFKSDVWSFGIFTWEIFSMGDIPYSEDIGTVEDFENSLRNGLRPMPSPCLANREIQSIIDKCLRYESIDRPGILEIYDELLLVDPNNTDDKSNSSDDSRYGFDPDSS